MQNGMVKPKLASSRKAPATEQAVNKHHLFPLMALLTLDRIEK